MNPNTAQTACQIGILVFSSLAILCFRKKSDTATKAVFLILVILCGYGSFHFGKKLDTATKKDNQNFQEQVLSGQNEIIEYMKEVKIEGDKELTYKIGKPDKWDFSIGTISFWVEKESFSDKRTLNLLVISEDNIASIEFLKHADNKVQFIYSFPTIGKIVRETRINTDEIKEKGVYFAFTWDLKEARTVLYINGKERP